MTKAFLSDKNPLLKQVRQAVARGSLTSDGFAVAESVHLLEEALASGCEIASVIVAESAADASALSAAVHRGSPQAVPDLRIVYVRDAVFAGLSSTEASQGVITLVKPPSAALDQTVDGKSLLIVLDGIQDPGNAGAILRAAEAFGATGAVFLKGTVNPYNPKCLRASAGSVFRIPLPGPIEEQELIQTLERKQVRMYVASPRGKLLASDANLVPPCAIVIGSEGRGASPGLVSRSTAVRIPTSGVESLNAAVAAAVLLYEARRRKEAR